MRQEYVSPEMQVMELKLHSQLLQASVIVTEETTDQQW